MLALALVTFVLLFLGGGLATDVFDAIGLGSEFADRLVDRALAAGAARR